MTQWVPVKKGQPLAKIDTRDLEVSLARAKAAVEAAKSQEAGARAQVSAAESACETTKSQAEGAKSQAAAARAGLLGAKADSDRAEREYQRLLKLKESGLATQQNLDDGQTQRDAAKARVDSAEAQINSAEAQFRAAEAQITSAKSQAEAARAQAKAAQAQIAAAEEDVKRIETFLAKATITSPLNGIVAERFINPGDLPGDGPMFRIVDNRVLDLAVSVPSQSISKIKAGQPLSFATDAMPGETFLGKVMFINPYADAADRSLKVTAEVQNPEGKLKGGFFVRGKIITGERATPSSSPETPSPLGMSPQKPPSSTSSKIPWRKRGKWPPEPSSGNPWKLPRVYLRENFT
ncbi:efflux RND transporter periplasmic adaptor subunit [bacterium]|nr:MAG: efflux RND transporter periplasmic adaptor subunit [bacterium]